jgi:hypothetical protein
MYISVFAFCAFVCLYLRHHSDAAAIDDTAADTTTPAAAAVASPEQPQEQQQQQQLPEQQQQQQLPMLQHKLTPYTYSVLIDTALYCEGSERLPLTLNTTINSILVTVCTNDYQGSCALIRSFMRLLALAHTSGLNYLISEDRILHCTECLQKLACIADPLQQQRFEYMMNCDYGFAIGGRWRTQQQSLLTSAVGVAVQQQRTRGQLQQQEQQQQQHRGTVRSNSGRGLNSRVSANSAATAAAAATATAGYTQQQQQQYTASLAVAVKGMQRMYKAFKEIMAKCAPLHYWLRAHRK